MILEGVPLEHKKNRKRPAKRQGKSDAARSEDRPQQRAFPEPATQSTSRSYFVRYEHPSPDGLILHGQFWEHGIEGPERRRFCLTDEDAARGLLVFGLPGSGKTQAVILPIIAEHLLAGHSLIIADPQGELAPYITRMADVTRHRVVIHDPTNPQSMRFNLAEGLTNASDARAIASVLVPAFTGDNRYWSDSATALLAAGLLRYGNPGAVYMALNDMKVLANRLLSQKDEACLLASSFLTGALNNEWKTPANIASVLAAALSGWAANAVRNTTSASDFNAALLTQRPSAIILTCPERMRDVFAPYLGAVLCKLVLDLDTIGEQRRGSLPLPVALVLDEFPTLGRLDSLVTNINLTRKRRIAITVAAQTKSQLNYIYGQIATEVLLAGLATQIVYGGGDIETATYYSRASGWIERGKSREPGRGDGRGGKFKKVIRGGSSSSVGVGTAQV